MRRRSKSDTLDLMIDRALPQAVVTPTPGLDPRIALATSMQASPGVYAVLLGSGISTAAGIPTGWEVVRDLVLKIALNEDVAVGEVDFDPVSWYVQRFGHEPRYDALVRSLAITDPARRALLRAYFDPPPDAADPVEPTLGHRVLARLVAEGRVRIVLTTNFDHLMERALADAGVAPQVLVTTEDLRGMTPLVHARATLAKLSGDYTSRMRNSPEELADYPAELRELLDRILDEYGLLIIGWSGEYDTALIDAIAGCPSRRYPTYWITHRNSLTEGAKRLVDRRQALAIDVTSADDFFVDLSQRIYRLEDRARRRGRPTLVRQHHLNPASWVVNGWIAKPWLHVRVGAIIRPATLDECGIVTPDDRAALTRALAGGPLIFTLSSLAALQAVSATAPGDEPTEIRADPFTWWELTPGAQQTDTQASYRAGGDATAGVSAVLAFALPGAATGSVTAILDVALSLAGPIRLGQLAILWRDALLCVSQQVPNALGQVLPPDAEADVVEFHTIAPASADRNNRLSDRLDLRPFGVTGTTAASFNLSFRLGHGLTQQEAGELVAEAVLYTALANGYIEPGPGIAAVRAELGLHAAQPTAPQP
jgi:SIR2-like domain